MQCLQTYSSSVPLKLGFVLKRATSCLRRPFRLACAAGNAFSFAVNAELVASLWQHGAYRLHPWFSIFIKTRVRFEPRSLGLAVYAQLTVPLGRYEHNTAFEKYLQHEKVSNDFCCSSKPSSCRFLVKQICVLIASAIAAQLWASQKCLQAPLMAIYKKSFRRYATSRGRVVFKAKYHNCTHIFGRFRPVARF